jgi:starch synthase
MQMKVMYITPECKPFSKVGGLADVGGELPPMLKRLGVDIEVVTPLYSSVDRRNVTASTIPPYSVSYENEEKVTVYEASLRDVPVWLLSNSTYFEGKYGQPFVNTPDIPFWDDIRRFAFFSKACLEFIRLRNPDIVHINDWLLAYLFGWMRIHGFRQGRVLTIHNVGYQGNIFKPLADGMPIMEFANDRLTQVCFEDPRPEWRSVNALRMGLELCHMANAVSPNYAKEITQEEDRSRYFEGGKGLHNVTRKLADAGHLIGILNGFEYKEEYSDSLFEQTLQKKEQARRSLGAYFGDSDSMLLGFVGRAVEQKFKLLHLRLNGRPLLEHILDLPGVNVAVLATGLPEYESFISNIAVHRFRDALSYDTLLTAPRRKNYASIVAFDRTMAERISLGCDVFLMPSLYEPCGITQMESMSYATPPLVRATGGLVDTVIPHDHPDGTGNGFVFDGATEEGILQELLRTVETARDMYLTRRSDFHKLQRNAFKSRFSWADSAEQYLKRMYEPVMRGLQRESTATTAAKV